MLLGTQTLRIAIFWLFVTFSIRVLQIGLTTKTKSSYAYIVSLTVKKEMYVRPHKL